MFDAFLLQPGATNMLIARDAMLAADMARFGAPTRWKSGALSRSADGC